MPEQAKANLLPVPIGEREGKEREKDDLTQEPKEAAPEVSAEQLFFGWKQDVRRYRKLNQGGTAP
jgi:hypothetical protein